jgi:hypothetical protein
VITRFGGQTIGVVTYALGAGDRLGVQSPTPTMVYVRGCLMRPMGGREKVTETDVAIQEWKITAPTTSDTLAVTVNGEIVYDGTATPTRIDSPGADGTVYQIIAVKPHPDTTGVMHHVTIICEKQSG